MPGWPKSSSSARLVYADRMLLGRLFSYADAHRARLGVNYQQIPVNAPVAPVHTYSKDGAMRVVPRSDPDRKSVV